MYEGVSVTKNIEEHASAPLYPLKLKHPHPSYHQLDRLIIRNIYDPELRALYKKYDKEHDGVIIGGQEYQKNPLDYIRVADLTCPCDDKILYEQIFGDPEDQPNEVMAYKSCKHTIYAAAKRQMKAAPTPEPAVADDFYQYSKTVIEAEIGEELNAFGYSYQDWYHHLNYKKQKDMDIISKYNVGEPLTSIEMRRFNQMNYEGICKVELQTIKGKPRMVCSIPLQTKYIMGPVCWHLEEIMAKKFKGYCGGKNLDQMAKMINEYIDQGFTKVVEGDGSAFDNTQDITLKRVDHYLYQRVANKVYHVSKEKFLQVATEPYKTMDVVYTDKHSRKQKVLFTYSLLGSVFSGDADTTLCNTLRMALYNRYVNDKAGLKYGIDYIVFSKGDDFTVMYKQYITDEQIHNLYYKYFLPANPDPSQPDTRIYGLGQVLKMLDIGGPETIKFCSLRAWIIDQHQHIMLTRDPAKFSTLCKYSRKTKVYNVIQKAAYLIEQALALEQSYKGLEYFDAMAHAYIQKAHEILAKAASNKYELAYLKQQTEIRVGKTIKDRRSVTSEYENNETQDFQTINDVWHREQQIKIQDNYWETMKRVLKRIDHKYSKQELELANKGINAEFNKTELLRTLGMINASSKEK